MDSFQFVQPDHAREMDERKFTNSKNCTNSEIKNKFACGICIRQLLKQDPTNRNPMSCPLWPPLHPQQIEAHNIRSASLPDRLCACVFARLSEGRQLIRGCTLFLLHEGKRGRKPGRRHFTRLPTGRLRETLMQPNARLLEITAVAGRGALS